jgi:hypothetical protein
LVAGKERLEKKKKSFEAASKGIIRQDRKDDEAIQGIESRAAERAAQAKPKHESSEKASQREQQQRQREQEAEKREREARRHQLEEEVRRKRQREEEDRAKARIEKEAREAQAKADRERAAQKAKAAQEKREAAARAIELARLEEDRRERQRILEEEKVYNLAQIAAWTFIEKQRNDRQIFLDAEARCARGDDTSYGSSGWDEDDPDDCGSHCTSDQQGDDCGHSEWWDNLADYGYPCSQCGTDLGPRMLQCPGCSIVACPKCKRSLQAR